MNQVLLLTANIILYLILLLINFLFKNSFDRKIDNYRTENVKTIEMFRDELFKKNRRFELKYDIYKGFAWSLPQIHWIVTQFDLAKLTESFEKIWYWRVLVSNFYGEEVKKKLEIFRDEVIEIQKKRDKINIELNNISWERVEIEEQKKYLNIIFSTEPKDVKEIFDRISLEVETKIKDKTNFQKQTEIITGLMKEIKSAFEKIYPLCEDLLITMSAELKEAYQLED